MDAFPIVLIVTAALVVAEAVWAWNIRDRLGDGPPPPIFFP